MQASHPHAGGQLLPTLRPTRTPARRDKRLGSLVPSSVRPRLLDAARRYKGEARARASELAVTAAERLGRRKLIALDYAPTADNSPRYGHGRPGHSRLADVVAERDPVYHEQLDHIAAYVDDLKQIDVTATEPCEPSWVNGFLPGLDGAAIYTFLRDRDPAEFVEIGSGNSTKFAARACRDGDLKTRITSIDPDPRADVDALCDDMKRTPLESSDLSVFDRLSPGDVLFFDGSHRLFMNSDVAAFFLDVLPELPPDVLVGVHDVYLPDDYDPSIADRYYSEQYMLAAYLIADQEHLKPVLPSTYVSRHPRFAAQLEDLWSDDAFEDVEHHGSAFWLTTAA